MVAPRIERVRFTIEFWIPSYSNAELVDYSRWIIWLILQGYLFTGHGVDSRLNRESMLTFDPFYGSINVEIVDVQFLKFLRARIYRKYFAITWFILNVFFEMRVIISQVIYEYDIFLIFRYFNIPLH